MDTVVGMLVVVVALYGAACVFVGMQRSSLRLDNYEAEIGRLSRQFDGDRERVLSAYRAGVARTPGMSIIDGSPDELLIDSKPTSRILGGNFGMVIRLRFVEQDAVTSVETDAAPKVGFAWNSDSGHATALQHAERSLRMNAKRSGITERLALDR